MDYQEVTIESLNSGAMKDLFEAAWKRLLENIGDSNTKADAVREVRVVVKVKPDKKRESAVTTVAVTDKLTPINPHESFILLSSDGTKVSAYTTDPNQQSLALEGGAENNVRQFPAAAGGGK